MRTHSHKRPQKVINVECNKIFSKPIWLELDDDNDDGGGGGDEEEEDDDVDEEPVPL
jgi:hypothetical protein